MQERRQYDRRTGVAMLSLVAATNVVPWMELLLGGTATAALLAPSEIRVAVGSCFLAVLLLLLTWFFGRRGPMPQRPRLERPRRVGTQLAVCAAGANLALAGAVLWLGAHRPIGVVAELPVFAALWYLVILPAEVFAAFALGRSGQDPGRRQAASPSPTPPI